MNYYTKFEHAVWMHRTHTCPKCRGAAKLQENASQAFVVKCRECGFNRDGIEQGEAVDAFAAWAQLPRAAIDLGVSLNAAVEMCARLMGWIDFPTDSGEGDVCWFKDPERAPFGRYVNKEDWTPLTSVSKAMDLALRYQLEIKVTHEFVYVTLPDTKQTQVCGWNRELRGEEEQHAKQAALCKAIVLACAAIYMQRGPDSLLAVPVETKAHDA